MNKCIQNKCNQNKFLQTRIRYESDYTIKDVLNELCKDIFFWIDGTPEVEHDYDKDTFLDKFYKFIYYTYNKRKKEVFEHNDKETFKPYDEELYEYFSLKFSQDIIDLFMRFRETTRCYNLSLFHQYNDNSLDLEQFLFNHILVEDPYNDETDEINNIDNGIDEPYL